MWGTQSLRLGTPWGYGTAEASIWDDVRLYNKVLSTSEIQFIHGLIQQRAYAKTIV